MFKNVNDYLPIGTIINVKNTDKKVMVYGIIQSDQSVQNGTEFDYIVVPYPEGNMGLKYQYLINESDIENIVFRGYEDKEREEFLGRLAEYKEKNNL